MVDAAELIREAAGEALTDIEASRHIELYDYQKPPADLGDKEGWLLLAGRGAGKTLGTMKYLSDLAHQHPGLRARIIAPTLDDAVNSCVLDPDSGLAAIDPEARLVGGLGGTRVELPYG